MRRREVLARADKPARIAGRGDFPRLGRVMAVVAMPGLSGLAACTTQGASFLGPAGIVAESQRTWLIEILLILLIVAAPVLIGLPICVWRYRRHGRGAYRPHWGLSRPLEYAIWGVPCLVVLALSALVIGPESKLSPFDPLPGGEPLRVQVVALNWKWLFLYPEQHVASVDRLAIPVGRPVRFYLTSDSTMQSFFIPALGSQIYAMAGMVTRLNLRADRAGTFAGENTQFNGTGFRDDRFRVDAMTQTDFAAWVARRQAQPKLDSDTYATLAAQGTAQDAIHALPPSDLVGGMPGFSLPEEDVFRAIVARYNPSIVSQ